MTTAMAAEPMAWIRLLRPTTLLAAAAAVAVGAAVSGEVTADLWPAMAATALAVASANVFNDVHDVVADTINQPTRPIPAGIVTAGQARRLGVALGGLAVIAAVTIGLIHTTWVATMVLLGLAYSWQFKRLGLAGNLSVAFLFANTIVFGASVGGGIDAAALVGAAEVGCVVLGRELLKTVPDMEGDAFGGASTAAVRWGWRRAVGAFVTVTSVSLVAAAAAWVANLANGVHVGAMVIGVALPSAVIGRVALSGGAPARVGRLLELTRFVWASGLGAVLLLAPV